MGRGSHVRCPELIERRVADYNIEQTHKINKCRTGKVKREATQCMLLYHEFKNVSTCLLKTLGKLLGKSVFHELTRTLTEHALPIPH